LKKSLIKILSFGLLTIVLLSTSCVNRNNNSQEMQRLDNQCIQAVRYNNFNKADSIGTILLNDAKQNRNKFFEARAYYYLGVYNSNNNTAPKRLSYLKNSLALAQQTDDDTLVCRIYNMLGIYETAYFKRYYMAQYYYGESMRLGRQLHNKYLEMSAESNLSETYRLLQDTIGLRYDQDIFEYAQQTNNKMLKRVSAYHCAKQCIAKRSNWKELKPYIEALSEDKGASTLLNIILAEYYMNQEEWQKAYRYGLKAVNEGHMPEDGYFIYAKILTGIGKYKESNDLLQQLKENRSSITSDYTWSNYYALRADNYHKLGEEKLVYKYLKRYSQFRDSLLNLAHEDRINVNRVKYEVEKKNQEIAHQRQVIRQQLIISLGVIFLIVTFYYLYDRRNKKFYRKIVERSKSTIEYEKLLQQRHAQKENNKEQDNQSVSDHKLDEIFEKILVEMEENEIFCDPTITRDTFSERVGCSHTYLTQAIKVKTGMSYSQFMNSYRIQKAVKILSDVNQKVSLNDLSKQLGFIAYSSFYTIFQQQIGISPTAYRNSAIKLNKEKGK
jgi:AraC-like DNA-binding protein